MAEGDAVAAAVAETATASAAAEEGDAAETVRGGSTGADSRSGAREAAAATAIEVCWSHSLPCVVANLGLGLDKTGGNHMN